MPYYVYILHSASINRFYTGHTQDIENRLREHNAGETASLRKGIPWVIVWQRKLESRAEAMALESKIKSRGAKRFLLDQEV